MQTIYEMLHYNANRHRERTAIIHEGKRLSYRTLVTAIHARAYCFLEQGITKGCHVGLLRHNSIGFIIDFFALQKCGAVAILLNWRWPATELACAIDESDMEGLVREEELGELAREALHIAQRVPQFVIASTSWHDLTEQEIAELSYDQDHDRLFPALAGDDPALAFFTGGSTGVPKAAIHSQAGLAAWVNAMVGSLWSVGPYDVVLNPAPLFHLNGMQQMLYSLCGGATFVLTGKSFEPSRILSLVEEEGVTQINIVPQTLVYDLAQAAKHEFYDLSSVKLASLSGAANREEHILEAFKLFPNASFFHPYGMTELAATTIHVMSREQYAHDPAHRLSVGRMAHGSLIKLVDDEGKPVPAGTPGRAFGKATCMFAGYHGRPPELDQDGFFDTGDVLVADEEGYFFYVGRSKLMVKTGGENVYCNEVEGIIRLHPAVCECVVFGLPDEKWGEAVSTAIELKPGMTVEAKDIIEHCRNNTAHYKKPRNVFFVDKLPRNPVGKIPTEDVKSMLNL